MNGKRSSPIWKSTSPTSAVRSSPCSASVASCDAERIGLTLIVVRDYGGALPGPRVGSAHPMAGEARRLQHTVVAGDAHGLIARERGRPPGAVHTHRERRGGVGVGRPEIGAHD